MSMPLLFAIMSVLTWSAMSRDRNRTVAASALFANLLLCWGIWKLTGEGYDPLSLFAVDFTTAILIVVATTTRLPLVVAAIYAVECIMHGAACALGPRVDATIYADALKALAWAQVLFVGGWGGYFTYRRYLDPHHRHDDAEAGGAALASMVREANRP